MRVSTGASGVFPEYGAHKIALPLSEQCVSHPANLSDINSPNNATPLYWPLIPTDCRCRRHLSGRDSPCLKCDCVRRPQAAHPTRRRVAPMLLPFLFILYVTNYLHRTSEAYAALEMSRDDLGLSGRA